MGQVRATWPEPSGRRGLEKMEEVYGFEMSDGAGELFRYTADHLFADIWGRPGLSDRDRRLLLIGMLTGTGAHDVLSSSRSPRPTPRVSLTTRRCGRSSSSCCHYAGWPDGHRLNSLVEETIAKAPSFVSSDSTFEELPAGDSGLLSARSGTGPGRGRLRRRGASTSRAALPSVLRPGPRARGRPHQGRRTSLAESPGSFSGTVVVEWLNVAVRVGRARTGPTSPTSSSAAATPGSASRRSTSGSRAGPRSSASGTGPNGIASGTGTTPWTTRGRLLLSICSPRWRPSRGRRSAGGPGGPLPACGGGVAVGVHAHDVRQRRPRAGKTVRRLPRAHPRQGAMPPARGSRWIRAGTRYGESDADPRRPRVRRAGRPDRDRRAGASSTSSRPDSRTTSLAADLGGRRDRARRPVPDRGVRGAARLPGPVNRGQQGYVLRAALRRLEEWARGAGHARGAAASSHAAGATGRPWTRTTTPLAGCARRSSRCRGSCFGHAARGCVNSSASSSAAHLPPMSPDRLASRLRPTRGLPGGVHRGDRRRDRRRVRAAGGSRGGPGRGPPGDGGRGTRLTVREWSGQVMSRLPAEVE